MGSFIALPLAAVLACAHVIADEKPADDKSSDSATAAEQPGPAFDREQLERQFAEKLTGATLVGHFTDDSAEHTGALTEDRYTIDRVTKGKNDFWLFNARIQYEGRDVKVTLPLEVYWAGDTPVITVTKVLVPGLGVFTARILIYGDQYAGTWSGGDHGGHMFGRIERATDEETATNDDEKSDGNDVSPGEVR